MVTLKGRRREGLEISQPGAAIIQIRDGLGVAFDFYMVQDQARRDAGLS